jgi:ADP-heptose:LPS heptosyltransferase
LSTKVLIVRFSSIGDIILTTPVIRCLKQQFDDGNAEIHYLTKKSFVPLLQQNPYIDRILTIDEKVSEIADVIRQEDYPYIIDLHRNLRSAQVKRLSRGAAFSFEKLNFRKWIFVNFKWNVMPDVHIVDRYMDTTKPLSIKNDHGGLDNVIPKADEVNIFDIQDSLSAGYISFAIGGQHQGKMLPERKIIELCNGLETPVMLLGGPEDQDKGERIRENSNANIYNACGKFSINQSADLVRQSLLLITHDTGLMHIGAALKKNVISIWGATVPELGMYPYMPGKDSKIFRSPKSSSPYSKLGNKQWYKKAFDGFEKMDMKPISDYANSIAAKA